MWQYRRQKCCAKGSGKEIKIQEFVYRDTANVEPEMYDCTSNNWSHWNSNEKLKAKFWSCTRKTFDRFTTKDSYTWNITHNTETWPNTESLFSHVWARLLSRRYDLYQRLQLAFYVLLMTGAMDARNMYSNLAVNKYLHTVASCCISWT